MHVSSTSHCFITTLILSMTRASFLVRVDLMCFWLQMLKGIEGRIQQHTHTSHVYNHDLKLILECFFPRV